MLALVDTSIWIDHLRHGNRELIELLQERRAVLHSAVIGELACGSLSQRARLLTDLESLPKVKEASPKETLLLIEERKLFGKGLGWVDMQLLASSLLANVRLLTLDKRLASITR